MVTSSFKATPEAGGVMMWGFLVVIYGFFENVRRLRGYNLTYDYTTTSPQSRRKFVLGVEVSISALSSCDSGVCRLPCNWCFTIQRLRRLVLYRLFRRGKRATS